MKSSQTTAFRMRCSAFLCFLLLFGVSSAQAVRVDETIAAAIAVARREVVNEFGVPKDKVLLVGQPLDLKDHASMHRRAKVPGEVVEAETKKSRTVLVTLRADLGDRVCGPLPVLVEGERIRVLTPNLSRTGERTLPFTAGECERVLGAIDYFMAAVLDYTQGPKRFLPLLAKRTVSDVLHDEMEDQLSNEGRRQMLSYFLHGWFFFLLQQFEGIEPPEGEGTYDAQKTEKELEKARDNEGRYLQILETYWRGSFGALSKFRLETGVLDKEHLGAIRPCLRYSRSVIDKHQADSDTETRVGAAVVYHFEADVLDFFFVWESDHLRLCSIYCRQ